MIKSFSCTGKTHYLTDSLFRGKLDGTCLYNCASVPGFKQKEYIDFLKEEMDALERQLAWLTEWLTAYIPNRTTATKL